MERFLTDKEVAEILPLRDKFGNKGSFGSLLSVCGSEYMTGAAYFVASAAARTGVGLVTVAAPKSVLKILQTRLSEPVFSPLSEKDGKICEKSASEIIKLLERKSALVIGSGIGTGSGVEKAVKKVIAATELPKIIDADALNVLSKTDKPFKNCKNAVITPHPLEFSRLSGLLVSEITENREKVAKEYSEKNGVITVLKGAYTVIAAPDGKTVISPFATSALAKGGSGDVLAGLIAGFAATGVKLFDAAVAGVYIHGLSATLKAKEIPERCFLPSDLLSAVPDAVKYLEELK